MDKTGVNYDGLASDAERRSLGLGGSGSKHEAIDGGSYYFVGSSSLYTIPSCFGYIL